MNHETLHKLIDEEQKNICQIAIMYHGELIYSDTWNGYRKDDLVHIASGQTFYEGYKKIRDNKNNANNLFEIPALLSLLPNLKDKRILDLGCGFGEHCKMFIEKGAASVVGIDISEKMLEVAKSENSDEKIIYLNMAMEDIGQLDMEFDLVVSSLAFHYD